MNIPFNKPFLTGKETDYIREAIASGWISGDGVFTRKCQAFFRQRYGFQFNLMTTSCTDALEMAAILLNIRDGDEVIIPSFTFVSTANAFHRSGAKIVFADSSEESPNVNAESIARCLSRKTRACVIVHYAGISCNMGPILDLVRQHNLVLIEDAAQAIESTHRDQWLGSFGEMSTFSFHETKNITCGEGGLLVVNDEALRERAEILWHKGTNRGAFSRKEVSKYEWVDTGSSFLPSELCSAFLYAQLEHIERIQKSRVAAAQHYSNLLGPLSARYGFGMPDVPDYGRQNGHMFYLTCSNIDERNALIRFLAEKRVSAVFHYLPLHKSPFYTSFNPRRQLINAERYSDCLIRLPMYFGMGLTEIEYVVSQVEDFYRNIAPG